MKKLVLLVWLLLCASTTYAQVPTAPTSLTVTNGAGNNINLSWNDNSGNESEFLIERKLGTAGTYAQIDTVLNNVTSYADNSAKTANRPYIYRVRASNGSGSSAPTNEDDAITPFTCTGGIKTDTANYSETPTTMPLPLAGGKFYDETFCALVMRLTDESDGIDFATNYSVWPTFNRDNTKVFFFSPRVNNYYTATLNPSTFARVGALQEMANPPASLFSHRESAFWSFLDSDKLFVIVDAKIYFYRPSTNAYTLVKDLTASFPAGYYFIQLYVSNDDNRFGIMIRNSSSDQGFIVYEQSTDTLKMDVRTTDMNGITMDKSGNYVLYVADTPSLQRIYTVNTGAFEALVSDPGTGEPDFQIGHNDTGVDFVVSDDQWRGGFSARNMSTPHTVTLAFQYAPYWISHHVSGRADNDNWFLVSTYGAVAVSADPNKYKREMFQIGVQGTFTGSLRRLAHTRAEWATIPGRTITGATNASPIVITTSVAHGFTTGQIVQVSGVGGNTAANGLRSLTVQSSTTFSLDGSTGNGAYTSGGSTFIETYWDTPRATISRDGRFLAWTSNWNGIPGGSRREVFIAQVEPAPGGPGASSGGTAQRGQTTRRGKVSIR